MLLLELHTLTQAFAGEPPPKKISQDKLITGKEGYVQPEGN